MSEQNMQGEKIYSVNPIATAVTVAVVGTGIAVAGAIALKNKKNRSKVKKVLTNTRKQASVHVKNIKNQAQDTLSKTKKKINKKLKK